MSDSKLRKQLIITRILIVVWVLLGVAAIGLGFELADYRLHHGFYSLDNNYHPDPWHGSYSPQLYRGVVQLAAANSVALIVFSNLFKPLVSAKSIRVFAMVLGIIGVLFSFMALSSPE
jgi:hypothetical protein